MIIRVAKMMPNAESYGVSVLFRSFANTPPAFGDVLNGSMDVQIAHQQARQATAIADNDLHTVTLTLASARSATDHQSVLGRQECMTTDQFLV